MSREAAAVIIGIEPEALSKFFPEVPALQHAKQKARQQGEEDEWEEKVVDS